MHNRATQESCSYPCTRNPCKLTVSTLCVQCRYSLVYMYVGKAASVCNVTWYFEVHLFLNVFHKFHHVTVRPAKHVQIFWDRRHGSTYWHCHSYCLPFLELEAQYGSYSLRYITSNNIISKVQRSKRVNIVTSFLSFQAPPRPTAYPVRMRNIKLTQPLAFEFWYVTTWII